MGRHRMNKKPILFSDERGLDDLSRRVCAWFKLPDERFYAVIGDYRARVQDAEAGDVVSARKLLDYVRYCCAARKPIDPVVAGWLSHCLWLITFEGVDANKALGVRPDTGRPPIGGCPRTDALIVWQEIERTRLKKGGITITAAAAIWQEGREQVISACGTGHRERAPSVGTIIKDYRAGRRLVEQYLQESGRKGLGFPSVT